MMKLTDCPTPWWRVCSGRSFPGTVNYFVLVWLCYRIQKTLHDSRLYGPGAWQVVVGALVLNPCALQLRRRLWGYGEGVSFDTRATVPVPRE
jgi:hypothetical protein